MAVVRGEIRQLRTRRTNSPRVAVLTSPRYCVSIHARTVDNKMNVTGTENVAKLAAQAKAMGVNTVFVCGSMAEFDK